MNSLQPDSILLRGNQYRVENVNKFNLGQDHVNNFMMLQLGYLAALVSCLSFGSFAVPIKGRVANEINIDPLVMQTYKTVLCFVTSWLVLLLPHVDLTFTWWGMVSGLFWVPGGTAGIYAVRNAGLAVSQGTWSALKVMVAFVWGIGIFREHVRSKLGATVAVLLLITGLWGMSYFSSSKKRSQGQPNEERHEEEVVGVDENDLEEPLLEAAEDNDESTASDEPRLVEEASPTDTEGELDPSLVGFRFFKLSRRTMGMICACVDGIWGGSILVPMHFAKTNVKGLEYVVSFAVGATTVLIALWMVRIAYNTACQRSFRRAIEQLPPLHLRVFWKQGILAGLLWSIGNVSSMLSVEYLGEGVGYSIVQAQMLVAGMYGVLLYREVRGWRDVTAWFICALLTLTGILLLSHEHSKK